MIYTLKNDKLTVKISDVGAEIVSAVSAADGCEYMWQADPAFWGRTAPWLFPVCSAMYEGKYTYRGKTYPMPKHGFAPNATFAAVEVSDTALTLEIAANERTKAYYPFDFRFSVRYVLTGDTLCCDLTVANEGEEMMYATLGGHPGFQVPLGGEGEYTDYYLEFSEPCYPDAVVFTEQFYDSGKRAPYLLEGNRRFRLSHELFRVDGVFLSGMARRLTLKSDTSAHSVTVDYGDATYVGIWSSAKDAPYVCVEPWYGMASFEGVSAIEEKSQMFRLGAGEKKAVQMTIAFQ